jgi:uncharacterized protein
MAHRTHTSQLSHGKTTRHRRPGVECVSSVNSVSASAANLEQVTAASPHQIARPVMLQGWHDLAALHWRYDPAVVQATLPDGFRVDTFDGSAWVGVIPFQMHRIRVPGLPAFGPLSTFPETNIRTYIVDPDGRRAVWFYSLDISRLIPALVARVTYRLPYCWASMTIESTRTVDGPVGEVRRYISQRRWPKGEAASTVAVRIGPAIAPDDVSELDHFLTARWALGSTWAKRLMWAKVDHQVWPLHAAEVLECDESLMVAAGLPAPTGTPIARWSPGVEVSIERPRLVRRM